MGVSVSVLLTAQSKKNFVGIPAPTGDDVLNNCFDIIFASHFDPVAVSQMVKHFTEEERHVCTCFFHMFQKESCCTLKIPLHGIGRRVFIPNPMLADAEQRNYFKPSPKNEESYI